MARTYLVFGDVEGKLDVLRVARGPLPTQGLLSRPQANGKIRTQRQHDEMEAAAQRKEPVTLKRGDSIGIAITRSNYEDEINRSLACGLVGDMETAAPRVLRFGSHRTLRQYL
jgi:hypothetical protein